MMKKFLVTLAVVTLIVGITGVANVYALPWQDSDPTTDLLNITIYDGNNPGAPQYDGIGVGKEDNEVEPGSARSQDMDLEAFYLEDSLLTMVGGFDFMYGYTGIGKFDPGDLFIDLTGNGSYDYAVHFNPFYSPPNYQNPAPGPGTYFGGYDVYQITSTTVLDPPDVFGSSAPWRVQPGTAPIVNTGTYTYWKGLTDSDISDALEGDWPVGPLPGATYPSDPLHNAIQFDLSSIPGYSLGSGALFHYTMKCGNDVLKGNDPIPEPGTLLLLGSGLIGVFVFGRKWFTK